MLAIYVVLNMLSSVLISFKTKKILNAIVIYNLIWLLMVLLYHSGLIKYYEITWKTWTILITSEISLFLGYYLGHKIKFKVYFKSVSEYREISEKKLKKSIILMLLISSFAIIPNTFLIINRYGFNLLAVTKQIYYDNITGNGSSYIPYFGCATQAAMILCGIYVSKFGFKSIVAISFIMSVLYGLPTGSRGYLLFNLLFFLIPLLVTSNSIWLLIKRYGKAILVILAVGILIYQILTANRSSTIPIEPYLSETMIELSSKYPTIYKNFTYFTGSLGVLNEYTKEMDHYFGMNSFYSIYNLLNKFGANFKAERYQKFYDIPYHTNVGTWLRELIQDFGITGMLFVIFIFSFFLGYMEKNKSNNKISIINLYTVTVMYAMLIMSFYVWYLREGFIYVLIILYFVIKKYTKGLCI